VNTQGRHEKRIQKYQRRKKNHQQRIQWLKISMPSREELAEFLTNK